MLEKAIGTPQPDWEKMSLEQTTRKIEAGEWPSQLDVLDFHNILHAGAALDQWNTAALAAVGTEYSCFQAIPVPAAALRLNKICVFYGVTIETVPNPISKLVFRRNAAAGILQAEYDVEPLGVMERTMGFFSEPVVWDNNTLYVANAMARIATGAAARVMLMNFVFEPAGVTHQ